VARIERSARSCAGKKPTLLSRSPVPKDSPWKTVAATLGVARANIVERNAGARWKRGPQTRLGDVELAADIRRLVDTRPTQGYRRIAAILKRERRSAGEAAVNAKRVYRLMKKHGTLLACHTGRRRPRDGQVATIRSNVRWCWTRWSSLAGTVRSSASLSRSIAMIGK
jgi:transposase InsO family protein